MIFFSNICRLFRVALWNREVVFCSPSKGKLRLPKAPFAIFLRPQNTPVTSHAHRNVSQSSSACLSRQHPAPAMSALRMVLSCRANPLKYSGVADALARATPARMVVGSRPTMSTVCLTGKLGLGVLNLRKIRPFAVQSAGK